MEKKLKWGLLGAGALLDRWMQGAVQADDMEIAAVASRTRTTAKRQAEKWNIPEALTYDEMLARSDFDVLYIPVPHTAHKELAIRAMDTGHNVLVEKPGAVCASDWKEMTDCAKKNGVFLMEAVWTRFFPVVAELLNEIKKGTIGEVRVVQSAFAFRIADDYEGRLIDPKLGGGSLLDVGVYNLHFAEMIYGSAPDNLIGLASSDTDKQHLPVEEQCACVGQYRNGALAVMTSAIRTEMSDTAYIYGSDGYIKVPRFWSPDEIEIVKDGKSVKISKPVPQNVPGMRDEGYQFEIHHVNECIRAGLKESPLVPFSRTADVLAQCDELTRQWGIMHN